MPEKPEKAPIKPSQNHFMSLRSIFCLTSSRGRADIILHELNRAAFPNAEIGVLFFDRTPEPEYSPDWDPSASLSVADSSGPIRGVLARIAGVGTFLVPGVGSFVAAGAMVNAIKQPESVFSATAIADELVKLGVSPDAAARFERRVLTDGDILISFRSESPREILAATKILEDLKAADICTIPNPGRIVGHPGEKSLAT